MKLLKSTLKRIVLIIVMLSILITFLATPASYAKLDLKEGDFYYSGTTEGRYAPSQNIFSWLLSKIGDIADWLVGIITFGFRMVFVGWTALFEKILTWALESTTGVSADGSLVESSTDLTSISDSSGNITVEAIVYNRVPALSADIFNLEFDRTRSGTGKKMICEDCEKPVEECKKSATIENVNDETKIKCEATDEDGNSCNCNSCASCSKYISQLKAEKPLIIQLRELVATWYTIIRLLSVAAMLVVLIAVGIKMALSTIASDKAVYKRMLVDWVVGMIMIFAIHYFMIFIINMTNVLVDVIEQSAQSVNKVSMMQINGGEETEIANEELEIKIYEEVRTRAYDPKLTNGLIGMVMYMTLVFFAFKYTIIYIKRLLTIIVLTLMGPAVGVSYALQKVLSGKSSTLKTWLTEYIMNMIIQVVHALMYAIFISQALVLSLQNISGMIFALILMNYTSKADELFKKIFKFGGGDSLLGHTEGALEASMQSLQSAQGMIMGAKPVAKALTNTPYGKAVKGVGKAAVAAAVGGVGLVAKAGEAAVGAIRDKNDEKYDEEIGADKRYYEKDPKTNKKVYESDEDKAKRMEEAIKGIRDGGAYKKDSDGNAKGKVKNQAMLDRALLDTDSAKLEEDLKKAQEAFKNANKNDPEDFENKKRALQIAYNNSSRYAKLTKATQGKIALGHAQRAFEIRNEYKLRVNGNNASKTSQKVGIGFRHARRVPGAILGTMHFDSRNWKLTRDKDAIYNRFSSENLLGFTADDKKMFKQHVMTPIMHGFIGMGSLFFGMATVVANPKMGMALLATGTAYTRETFKRPTGVKASEGRYTFSRYGTLTMNAIKNSAIQQARRERRGLTAEHLEKTRPTFVEKFKEGKLSAVTIGVAFAPVLLTSYAMRHPIKSTSNVVNAIRHPVESAKGVGKFAVNVANETGNVVLHPVKTAKNVGEGVANIAVSGLEVAKDQTIGRFTARTALADHLEAIDNHSMIQQRKQEAEFKEDAVKMMNVQSAAEFEFLKNKFKEQERKEQEKSEIEIYAAMGYRYNPTTGDITLIDSSDKDKRIPNAHDLQETDLVLEGDKKITQAEVNTVNNEIDRVIMKLAESGYIDMNSEKVQDDAMKMLSDTLKVQGILGDNQEVGEIFRKGENGLKQALKLRAASANSKIEDAKNRFLKTEKGAEEKSELEKNQKSIMDTVTELTKMKMQEGKKPSEVTAKDVLERINLSRANDGSSKVSQSDGSKRVDELKLEGKDLQRIDDYIGAVTRTTTAGLSKAQVKEEVKRINKTRSEKLEQVLAISMDLDLDDKTAKYSRVTDQATSEQVIEQLLTQKGAQNVAGINLTASEADAASAMLKKLLDMKAINEVAVKDLDMKKGTSGYKKAKGKKSELALDILSMRKELMNTNDNDKINQINENIEIRQKELDIISSKINSYTVGPIADINDLLRKGIGRR